MSNYIVKRTHLHLRIKTVFATAPLVVLTVGECGVEMKVSDSVEQHEHVEYEPQVCTWCTCYL